ncbi:DNA polymerase I [Kocuria dechangensis]|uniref:DNA polymerase I n=1 Tax=Kocuria dechangensis TaxID=1176249 RepID=A0A917LU01_9MICC|nr:DNA polymerase I [Kocuria dechangensis]
MSTTTQQTQTDPSPETAVPTVTVGTETDHPVDVEIPRPVSRPDRKLLLIDGHSLAFRAFFALSRAAEYGGGPAFVTSDGRHTEAVYGFVNTLVKLVREQQPTHLVVSFDLDGPTLRSEQYEEYKGGRDETPEEFHGQVPQIQRILDALGVPVVTAEGHEADDVLATLARRGAEQDYEVLVFSGDRDAFQMIDDHVTVVYPGRTPSDLKHMDAAAVVEKYKIPPRHYPDLAALTGEQADNLPGVPGVGAGFAAKWILAYGGVDSLLENADRIKGKKGEALREHRAAVERNRRLNRLLTDLELDVDLADAALPTPDPAAVEEVFDDLEFGEGLRRRLFDAFGRAEEEGAAPVDLGLGDVERPGTAEELERWLAGAPGPVVLHALHRDDDALVPGARELSGMVLARSGDEPSAAFLDLAAADAALDAALGRWLADEDRAKVVVGLKDVWKSLAVRGLLLAGVVDDPQLSAYLLQPARRSYELEALLEDRLGVAVAPPADAAAAAAGGQQELSFDDEPWPAPDALRRAAELAVATAGLSEHLLAKLEETHQTALLVDLELPLAAVLGSMELAGIAVDPEGVQTLLDDFARVIEQAQEEALAQIAEPVNLGSPKQLQQVMFEELGLPKTKKIKSGYTTDADAVAELLTRTDPDSKGHRFLAGLLAYRDANKLRQTVEGLQKAIAEDGRVHTTYMQNVAATGRLSSTNPNLQNIPVRTEEGRRIRALFVVGAPSEGRQYEALLTADYSQIEMRIMAHLSGDAALIEAFREGEDLHRFVGSKIFGVAPADVTPEMRSKVKAMSYGLVYGLSSFGLSKQLRIPVDEARTLMSDYFTRFGAVRDYLRGVVEEARRNGYTATIDGRRRYLPDLSSDNRQLRSVAERAALNAPIQGSAADIIKKAMLGVARRFREEELGSRMLLQVHDELVVEVAAGEREAVERVLREEMGGAARLTVPLEVNVGVGRTWHEAAH